MFSKSQILEAAGASIRPEMLEKKTHFYITDFGASPDASPASNTYAINEAIKKAAALMGGTVVIPKGKFTFYTIRLKSNVNLFLENGAVIAAAKTDIRSSYEKQLGEGGNYDEPEINLYVGLQDHGHSYFANSLIYGADLENIMIYGKGLITGGRFDKESGILEYVLQGGDPAEPLFRDKNGHKGEWFGNKAIALVRCKNIVLSDFSLTIGGHFAVIAEGCENMYIDKVLIDTTRDALDIDCCQNVTVKSTVCNSLTDDAICLKSSFGAGKFMPVKNVLIEDCTVSGYDAGSVYAKKYTRDKLVAQDRCGPTGRVKFGTESTCGYHQVTIRRVKFDRSRGFALEAVDCSPLTDVIFTDCELDNVSNSPIFIRAGERARFPVTGNSESNAFPCKNDVRIDNPNWVLPRSDAYQSFPAKRYAPHYNRSKEVTVDGHAYFSVVSPDAPISGNLNANAIGSDEMASVKNIYIGNIRITNADPRYPILLMGLTDSHIQNVILENINVEYRGGLDMEHAIEQRQLNTEWKYSQFHAKTRVQNIPWLVNTFFLKNEGLLPRADWDAENNCWRDNPYNVPELPDVYPEPSNCGILPAYGIFAKHVDNLTLKNISITCKVPDKRHVCVFDDANGIDILNMDAYCAENISPIAIITDNFRRHTNMENVPNEPYFTTSVENLNIKGLSTSSTQPDIVKITINCPAPATPPDSLYGYPTVPCVETGYSFKTPTDKYPLPLTVHRPFIQPIEPVKVQAGETIKLSLIVRNPATDISDKADDGIVYNEMTMLNPSVKGAKVSLNVYCENLPENAVFDADKRIFEWHTTETQKGTYNLIFTADDGIIPESITIEATVL